MITNTTYTLVLGESKKSVAFVTNGEWIMITYRCEYSDTKSISGVYDDGGVWTLQEGSRMVGIDNARKIWNSLITAEWRVQT